MDRYWIIFLILSVLSLIYLKIATYFRIIDKPNHRSSHSNITIRGGGILFFISVLLFFILNDFQYLYFVIGISIIAIVSFLDDVITLSSKIRLPFQFIAILFVLLQLGYSFHPIWLLLILLILGVGFINVYNFMDGINGITGLYSISILIGLYLINMDTHFVDENLIIYVALSVFIFGFYNFRKKARFFAGDIGSISIAMVLFFIGVWLIKELKSPLILLMIVVYGADSLLTIVYRKSIGENITEPHRHHMYQKLVDVFKISHLKVAVLYASIQLLVNIIVYKFYKLALLNQFLIFFIVIIVFIFGYIILFNKTRRMEL